jgi:hypothetical protein
MILSTHAIIGGAIASLFPSHPVAAVASAFASHFAIDAIPHWDYPLRSIALGPQARNSWGFDGARFRDLSLVGFDALVGFALAVSLFATSATVALVSLGAVAAMLPDPLQFVHSLCPRGPLNLLQRFHSWIHSKRSLGGPTGISSQIAFALLVVGITAGLR